MWSLGNITIKMIAALYPHLHAVALQPSLNLSSSGFWASHDGFSSILRNMYTPVLVFPPPPLCTLTKRIPDSLCGSSKTHAKVTHYSQSQRLWIIRATGKCRLLRSVHGDWRRTVLSQSLLKFALPAASSSFSKWPQAHLSDQKDRLYANCLLSIYV